MAAAVPFSAFMAQALYDPQRGYYARQIPTVGARGDFSTTATLSPLLGQAVAGWLKSEAALQPGIRNIIEIGAGSGVLMAAVKKNLGWWGRRSFRFHIVETSPVLQQQQRQLLGADIVWHTDLKAALTACDGKAFLYHNELLDAFPATLLQWQENTWQEVYITPDGQEQLLPLDWPPERRTLFTALQDWPTKSPRQRIEIHATVHDWLHHWAPAWKAGAMLTVDYGDVFPALYHRRPSGTLRGYLRQHRLEGSDVYRNPGRQDITADINFSDWRAWAQSLGWQEVSYGTQADFIRHHVKHLPNTRETSFIMQQGGAGDAFKHGIHRIC